MCDIACGMQEAGLEEFAAFVKATHMRQWQELGLFDEGLEGWGQAFEQVVTRTLAAGGRIHFDLTRLDVAAALKGDPDFWADRYTAWELQQIVRNENWFRATVFYLNRNVLDADQLAQMGIVPPGQ